MTSVQKISPKLQQMYKKGEAGLVEKRSFVKYKYRQCQEKKAQNSVAQRGRLHGEIKV